MKQLRLNGRQESILWAKIRLHHQRTWCGYLTPVEIGYLFSKGCRAATHYDTSLGAATHDINQGSCRPKWFYFEPSAEVYSSLRNRREQCRCHDNEKRRHEN